MSELCVATGEALAAVVELDAACFARPWAAAAWRAEIEAGTVLLLREKGALLACACAPTILDVVELRRIAVDPRVRRRGYGRDLLATLIERARASGAVRVELEVAGGNVAACRLYCAHGFHVVGRRRGYYANPPDDALLMTLELPSNNVQCRD